jgi:hypothetical protein
LGIVGWPEVCSGDGEQMSRLLSAFVTKTSRVAVTLNTEELE